MSLINEALKRAKEAQVTAPPPALSAAQLHPVEPPPTARQSAGLMLPVALTLIALGGLFFLWQAAQVKVSGKTLQPASRPARSAAQGPAAVSTAPLTPAPSAATTVGSLASAVEQAAKANPAVPTTSALGTNTTAVATSANAGTAPGSDPSPTAATNLLTVTAPPLPKPAPLRLQAIVFNPVRPSAMISGKTLFIGDRLGEFRVQAITQDSATLASATRTNVLSLSE